MSDIFEGSEILELLAERDLLDAFMEAVDTDNIPRAIKLLKLAEIDEASIQQVIAEMKS